jgi:hypothetical protein
MAAPTRPQIESTVVLPHYKVEIELEGVYYTIDTDDISDISGDIRSTGSTVNGLAFGTYTEPSGQVAIYRRAVLDTGSATLAYDDTAWILHRMRISQAFDTSDYVPIFVGVIQSFDVDDMLITFRLISVLEYVRNTKIYTGATKNRPIATKTTISSEEDPTQPGYTAGTINRILWEAGGRPFAQYTDVTFSDAVFWYDCEQSIFAPQYTWLSGENLVEELFTLARSSGGQIFQEVRSIAGEGVPVIRYVQPLTLADLSTYASVYNFSADTYGSFRKTTSGMEVASLIKSTFTQRREYVLQEIYNDSTPKNLRAGETKEYDFETQLPVFSYEAITAANFRASRNHDNRLVDVSFTVVRQTATRITVEFENTESYPITIHEVKIKGVPLAVEEEGIVTYGSGEPVLELEDNPYIQSYGHALRLCRMVYDFYSQYRPIITLSNAIYDPDRFIGEIVQCINNDTDVWNGIMWVDNTVYYRIIGIRHSNAGATMEFTLVPIDNIPNRQDMYIVDETYISTDVRLLSY